MLDLIQRTGLGVRELLRVALGGVDPNNILSRLVGRGHLSAVRGLPQNRAYYLPGKTAKPLGPQSLHQRLALAWHICVNRGAPAAALTADEVSEAFGLPRPSGSHILEHGKTGRILHVYIPETVEVSQGIARHVNRAETFPNLQRAIKEQRYAFLTLCPWGTGLADALRHAAQTKQLAGCEARFAQQARKTLPLTNKATLLFAEAPGPLLLSRALKEAK